MCAAQHTLEEPHNQQSLFYQMYFHQCYGRWPTWKDAMEHCSEAVQKAWKEQLVKYGINAD